MENWILIDPLYRSVSQFVQEERLVVSSGIIRSRRHLIIRKCMFLLTFTKLRTISQRGNRNVRDDALQLGGLAGQAIDLLNRNFECTGGIRSIVKPVQKSVELYHSLYCSLPETARVTYDHSPPVILHRGGEDFTRCCGQLIVQHNHWAIVQ